jgi:hypothetical protein
MKRGRSEKERMMTVTIALAVAVIRTAGTGRKRRNTAAVVARSTSTRKKRRQKRVKRSTKRTKRRRKRRRKVRREGALPQIMICRVRTPRKAQEIARKGMKQRGWRRRRRRRIRRLRGAREEEMMIESKANTVLKSGSGSGSVSRNHRKSAWLMMELWLKAEEWSSIAMAAGVGVDIALGKTGATEIAAGTVMVIAVGDGMGIDSIDRMGVDMVAITAATDGTAVIAVESVIEVEIEAEIAVETAVEIGVEIGGEAETAGMTETIQVVLLVLLVLLVVVVRGLSVLGMTARSWDAERTSGMSVKEAGKEIVHSPDHGRDLEV